MSDTIAFACDSCAMRYSVQASYAGRQFACKKCGAAISVPHTTNISSRSAAMAPKVELDSGEAVMRKSDSGRTSARRPLADPTRVFTRQAAETPPPPPPAKSKTPLIAVIVAVVVIGCGLAAGYFTGVFGGKVADGSPQVAANTNQGNTTSNVDTPREQTPREKLLAELKDANLDARSLLEMWDRALEAKLEPAELKELSARIASQILTERGAGKTPDELVALGDKFREGGYEPAAVGLFSYVVDAGSKMRPRPEAYATAHARLGRQHVEFEPAIKRVQELEHLEILPEATTLRKDIEALRDVGHDGWVTAPVEGEFRNLVAKVEALEGEVERIRTKDPYRLYVAEERRRIREFEVWKLSNFLVIEEKPYLLFIERRASEDDAAVMVRVAHALAVVYDFTDWYRTNFADPVGLGPSYPTNAVDSEARLSYPHTYVFLRETSRWSSYLRDSGYGRPDYEGQKWFIEPETGRLSMVYVDQPTHLNELIDAVADVTMRRYHPRTPATVQDGKAFRPYGAHFASIWVTKAMKHTQLSVSRSTGKINCTFFFKSTRILATLKRWGEAYAKGLGIPEAFGGQALTIRQMVGSQSDEALATAMAANFKAISGWTDDQIDLATKGANFRALTENYGYGMYQFLWHYEEAGKPKYRQNFVKLLYAELQATDREEAESRFATAFRLRNDADWKRMQDDFVKYQQE